MGGYDSPPFHAGGKCESRSLSGSTVLPTHMSCYGTDQAQGLSRCVLVVTPARVGAGLLTKHRKVSSEFSRGTFAGGGGEQNTLPKEFRDCVPPSIVIPKSKVSFSRYICQALSPVQKLAGEAV